MFQHFEHSSNFTNSHNIDVPREESKSKRAEINDMNNIVDSPSPKEAGKKKSSGKISKAISKKRGYVKIQTEQFQRLREHYAKNIYPNRQEIEDISQELRLSYVKVDNWFKHNRRVQVQKGVIEYSKKKNFSKEEISILRKSFTVNNKPSQRRYKELAKELGCHTKNIKHWFSYQRRKLNNNEERKSIDNGSSKRIQKYAKRKQRAESSEEEFDDEDYSQFEAFEGDNADSDEEEEEKTSKEEKEKPYEEEDDEAIDPNKIYEEDDRNDRKDEKKSLEPEKDFKMESVLGDHYEMKTRRKWKKDRAKKKDKIKTELAGNKTNKTIQTGQGNVAVNDIPLRSSLQKVDTEDAIGSASLESKKLPFPRANELNPFVFHNFKDYIQETFKRVQEKKLLMNSAIPLDLISNSGSLEEILMNLDGYFNSYISRTSSLLQDQEKDILNMRMQMSNYCIHIQTLEGENSQLKVQSQVLRNQLIHEIISKNVHTGVGSQSQGSVTGNSNASSIKSSLNQTRLLMENQMNSSFNPHSHHRHQQSSISSRLGAQPHSQSLFSKPINTAQGSGTSSDSSGK